MARTRNTWVQRLNKAKQNEDFDVKDFAGRITFERLAVAKKAINAIGTPLLSGDLPNTEKAQEYIADQLQAACDRLLNELAEGKKSATKETGVVPF